jgi:hypothetical protein
MFSESLDYVDYVLARCVVSDVCNKYLVAKFKSRC